MNTESHFALLCVRLFLFTQHKIASTKTCSYISSEMDASKLKEFKRISREDQNLRELADAKANLTCR